MRSITDFNDGWLFEGSTQVRLPHSAVELPFSYFDEAAYQRPFTYEKRFAADPAWNGHEVSLVFDGAMANTQVRLNGKVLAGHKDGYTPFEVRLNGTLKKGDNDLSVTVDGTENPSIPPFGGMIDYLTYAGIYRDVWLKVTAAVSIGNVKIETADVLADRKSVTATVELANPRSAQLDGTLTGSLRNAAGDEIARAEAAVSISPASSCGTSTRLFSTRSNSCSRRRRDGIARRRDSGFGKPGSPPTASSSTAGRSSSAASTGTSRSPMSATPWAGRRRFATRKSSSANSSSTWFAPRTIRNRATSSIAVMNWGCSCSRRSPGGSTLAVPSGGPRRSRTCAA